ncbi:hypothetical protein PCI56_02155 [Plesiomonas shigelloides subsp. oncorhynchi]|nr:hypothetical protein [Plesiomonas shigelloides]
MDDNNLLAYWYGEQYGDDPLTRRHRDFYRGLRKKIESNYIPYEEKKMLFDAIREKEKLQLYLEDHYKKIVKQYKQVTMVTILLHLPKSCRPKDGYVTEDFGKALNKLNSKFSLFKRKFLRIDYIRHFVVTLVSRL